MAKPKLTEQERAEIEAFRIELKNEKRRKEIEAAAEAKEQQIIADRIARDEAHKQVKLDEYILDQEQRSAHFNHTPVPATIDDLKAQLDAYPSWLLNSPNANSGNN